MLYNSTYQPQFNPRFLPASLAALQAGRVPAAPMPPGAGGQRAAPPMHTLLQQMMQQQPKPYTNLGNDILAGGEAGYAGYKGLTQATRDDATGNDVAGGVGKALGGALTAAGSLDTAWPGKLAQVAGMMSSEYGKNKSADARGERLAKILAMTDPSKRADAAMQAAAAGDL